MNALPLFPLGHALYPGARMALQVFEPRYLDLVRNSLKKEQPFGIVLIREGSEVVKPEASMPRLAQVGTYARIVDWNAGENGRLAVTVEGDGKFRLLASSQQKDFLIRGEVERLPSEPVLSLPPEADGLPELLAQLLRHPTLATLRMVPAIDDAGRLVNQLAQLLPLPPEEQFALLADADPVTRLGRLNSLLKQMGAL